MWDQLGTRQFSKGAGGGGNAILTPQRTSCFG